jgi:hypothetical protein
VIDCRDMLRSLVLEIRFGGWTYQVGRSCRCNDR